MDDRTPNAFYNGEKGFFFKERKQNPELNNYYPERVKNK